MKEPKYGYHGNEIKPPINEHIPIIEHFWMFSSFLDQIELFLCHWMHKLEYYKFLWALEVKEQQKKHWMKMSDILLQLFWNNSNRPLSSSNFSIFFILNLFWIDLKLDGSTN
jgi:hypothetical protein